MRAVDLFSGVGGLSLGFVQDGFDIVMANEMDPEIAKAYVLNHRDTKMVNEDITKLDMEGTFGEYRGDVDVVIGGPPYQGFSQKGSRRTVDDERNFLFRHYCRAVEFLRPRYFVMENVPNILTAGNGLFRHEILALFKKMGYKVRYGVFDASDYGVPQFRRRAVFMGKLGSEISVVPARSAERVTIWDAISDLAYLESGEGAEVQPYGRDPESRYQRKLRGGCTELHNHKATSHSSDAVRRMKMVPPGCGREVLSQGSSPDRYTAARGRGCCRMISP